MEKTLKCATSGKILPIGVGLGEVCRETKVRKYVITIPPTMLKPDTVIVAMSITKKWHLNDIVEQEKNILTAV